LSERGAVRRQDAVVYDPGPDEQEQERSPFPPVGPVTPGAVWACPEASCQYRELGRMERAGGDGICPQHDEPLVRVSG
jgi:hypothetical protein